MSRVEAQAFQIYKVQIVFKFYSWNFEANFVI